MDSSPSGDDLHEKIPLLNARDAELLLRTVSVRLALFKTQQILDKFVSVFTTFVSKEIVNNRTGNGENSWLKILVNGPDNGQNQTILCNDKATRPRNKSSLSYIFDWILRI